MLILLSQNEQGISALDLQKHIFPSGSSSFGIQFIHEEYVSMDATSLRKLLQRGATVWNNSTWNSLNKPAMWILFIFSIKYQFLCILSHNLKHVDRQILHPVCPIGICVTSTIYIEQWLYILCTWSGDVYR